MFLCNCGNNVEKILTSVMLSWPCESHTTLSSDGHTAVKVTNLTSDHSLFCRMYRLALLSLMVMVSVTWAHPHPHLLYSEIVDFIKKANTTWTVRLSSSSDQYFVVFTAFFATMCADA